jgi:LuxR family maltose regulon positive regulatory protein
MGSHERAGRRSTVRPALEAVPGRIRRAVVPPLPRPEDLVVRNRLLDMIDRGVQGPLTLVSAPAGTGKTVAVATWAASGRAPGPVVWLELGDMGTSVTGLWPAMIRALRRAGVWVRQKPVDAVTAMYPTAISELGSEIVDHHEPIAMVLDCDVELPADTATAIHRLLVASGGQLRLILLSRADPLLPLHLYRLAQSVLEVRMADLAFTTPEARELLLRRGVDLPSDVVESVNERTRGWAAGLLLAAMSMAGSPDPVRSAQELSGAAGPIAEYLLAEVLDKQPPAVRNVLLRSSLVEVVQPGLVETVVGDGGKRALAILSHGSAFVDEIAGMPGWYRYHPLFRELLCAQFTYEASDEAARVRAAVADWYAANGLLEDAVRTATAAGAWEAAARYIVEDLAILALIDAGPDSPLHQAAIQLPDDLPGAAASLVRAALAFARQQHSLCAVQLHHAQTGIEDGTAEVPEAGGLVLAVLLMLLAESASGPDATLRAARNAHRLITEFPDGRVGTRSELIRVVHRTWATAALALGRLDEATEAYDGVTRGGPRAGREREYVDALGHLALLASWRGKMRRAVRLAHQALAARATVHQQHDDSVAAAEVALGFIYAETQDLTRAHRHVGEALGHGAENGDQFVRVALALVRARLHRAGGDLSAARAAVATVDDGDAPDDSATPVDAALRATMPKWLRDRMLVEQAQIELSAGRPGRADDVLTAVAAAHCPAAELVRTEVQMRTGRPVDPAEPPVTLARPSAPDLSERIDKRLVESQRRLRSGEQVGAIEALDRALRLAAPEHIRRPFLDAPVDVRRLLRSGDTRLAARHAWLTSDRSASGGSDGRPRATRTSGAASAVSPMVIEPLTAKEAEVLGHLAQLLTTEEIASAMYVSVNTIRTHVRNILRKLSASRRNEAIRRARELGILSS